MPKYKIKNRVIRELRREKRDDVESELQKLVYIKDNFKGTYQRLKFLNKFTLYNGLSRHYAEQQRNLTLGQLTQQLMYKSLDQYENEVMKIFNCDHEHWPLCLFDFTYQHKIPSFLCYRSSYDSPHFIDNYFYSNNLIRISESNNNNEE